MRSNSFRSFKWLQFNYISSHSIQTKWVKIPAWDRGHVYLSVQDGVAWLPIDTRGIEKRRDEYAFSHVERSKTELNRKVDHVTEINIFIQRHSVAIYHSARHLIDLTTGKNMSSKSELHTFSLNRIFNYKKMLNTIELPKYSTKWANQIHDGLTFNHNISVAIWRGLANWPQ